MFTENQKQILDNALSTFIYETKKNIQDHKGANDPSLETFISEQQNKLEEATTLRKQLREDNLWSKPS